MVLVTGSSGFIGSHLVEALCAQGESVRCLLRKKASRKLAYTPPVGAEVAYGDLVSGAGLEEALRDVDAVIHVAGVTKALSAAEFYAGNVRATENIARAVAQRAVPMVHVSSLAAIGPSLDGIPVAEDAEPHPLTHYGKSKLEAERTVRKLLPDAVIVRPPVVYGPRDTDVFQLLRSIANGLVVKIAGPERCFSAIYVKDLVEGLLVALRTVSARGRAYFLAHPTVVSWTHLGAVAANIVGCRPRVLQIPASLARVAGCAAEAWSHITGKAGIVSREKVKEALCTDWTCDSRRAARELAFQARTPLETGLAETLAWYKEAGWLKY